MLKIQDEPMREMIAHAEAIYPNECVGAMIGTIVDGVKTVESALRLENSAEGSQRAYYQLKPEHLLEADKAAREQGKDMIGIYHSHPDADAYFSQTDLKNSCPWFSFVVLSIREGKFNHANSWLPDAEQTKADKEELSFGIG
jgi:proteasome lid subunit RPN8/RPN11